MNRDLHTAERKQWIQHGMPMRARCSHELPELLDPYEVSPTAWLIDGAIFVTVMALVVTAALWL